MLRVALLLSILGACTGGEITPLGGSSGGGGDDDGNGLAPDAGVGGGGGGGGGVDAAVGGGSGSGSGTPQTLKITLTTTPSPAPVYDPNHVVAVWIEGAGGTFVKTIGRWAATRKQYLLGWNAKAGTNDADAVSGATINSHATPLNITWDLKNKGGTVVPDGTYTVRMELADRNATAQNQNNEGTFTFVKGTSAQTQSGISNGGFTNVTLTFTP